MANLITHYFFGAELCSILPKEEKDLVRRNRVAYNLGTVGPDALYPLRELKDKAAKLANMLHRNDVFQVFQTLASATRDNCNEEQFAYALGFLSHYILDKTVHPLVYFMSEEVLPKEYATAYQNNLHNLVESAADEWVLIKNYHNPRTFNSLSCARAPRRVKRNIGVLYEKYLAPICGTEVTAKRISLTLTLANLFGVLWLDKKGRKKRFLLQMEQWFSRRRNLSSLLRPTVGWGDIDLLNEKLRPYPSPRNSANFLNYSFPQLYETAKQDALLHFHRFWEARFIGKPLDPADFCINYEGVMTTSQTP